MGKQEIRKMPSVAFERRISAARATEDREGGVEKRQSTQYEWKQKRGEGDGCGLRPPEIQREEGDGQTEGGATRIVRNYLFRIFDKLGVSTRVELVLYCFQERQQSLLDGARLEDKVAVADA